MAVYFPDGLSTSPDTVRWVTARHSKPAKTTKIGRTILASFILANVQDEPRPSLARFVRLGARNVTARVVGSSAWFGSVRKNIRCGTDLEVRETVTILSRKDNRRLNAGITK